MSDESTNDIRIKQWFARGFGIIIAGLFMTILSFVMFGSLENSLFSNDLSVSDAFDFVLITKQIGSIMWTFRVFDLVLIVIVVLVGLISTIYITIFKSQQIAQTRDYSRRML